MTVSMSNINASLELEKEATVKRLKRNFDRWRELVLMFNSMLLWKKKAYPWVIFAVTTFVFTEVAVYDLTILTIVSLVLLVSTLVDFLAPIVVSTLVKDDWTSAKQKELEDVCKVLANVVIAAKVYYASLQEVKATRPNLYYPVTLVTLCLLAWLGNSVNNLFITYVIVLALLMTPGLVHMGILQKYYKSFMSQDFVKSFTSKEKSS